MDRPTQPGASIGTQPAMVDYNATAAMRAQAMASCEPHNVENPANTWTYFDATNGNRDPPMQPNIVLEPTMTYYPPRLPDAWSMSLTDFQTPEPGVESLVGGDSFF
jgi:hypothetical protein